MKRVDQIKKELSDYIRYSKATVLRTELNDISIKIYIQRYSDTEHIQFVVRNEEYLHIETVDAQDTNDTGYVHMFTTVTQDISADCISELFDKAIEIERLNS